MSIEEVHVLPLGWEFDRAVLPFQGSEGIPPRLYAHRIELLVPGTAYARNFPLRVKEALSNVSAVHLNSIRREDAGGSREAEFEDVLQVASQICARELPKGNRVHLNLSTGSKLAASALQLVGMAHLRLGRGTAYYVVPEGYSQSREEFETHGLAKGLKDVQQLHLPPLRLPAPLQLRVLSFLRHQHEPTADYPQLLKFLRAIPNTSFSDRAKTPSQKRIRPDNADNTTMVKTILTPLEEDGFVTISKGPHHKRVTLTNDGRLYAALSAIDQPGLHAPLQ